MSDPAVVAALAGAAGVVAGTVVSTIGVLFREGLVSKREREARQFEREQARQDAHDASQRDAILGLHNAVTAYWELAVDAGATYQTTELRRGELRSIALPMNTAFSRMTLARAKVFDDEFRRLVQQLDEEAGKVSSADANRQQFDAAFSAGTGLLTEIEQRVNALLRAVDRP